MSDVFPIRLDFKNASYLSFISPLSAQIETKKFGTKFNKSVLDRLKGSGDKFDRYKKTLSSAFDEYLAGVKSSGSPSLEREYYSLAISESVRVDPFIELEKLGIEQYTKPYTTIIDMEQHLDLALHMLCGCSIKKVANIPEYSRYSRALMCGNSEDSRGLILGDILTCCPKIEEYLSNIEEKLYSEDELVNMNKKMLDDILSNFYSDLFLISSTIREHIFCAFKKEFPQFKDIVYRSKNHHQLVIASDVPMNLTVRVESEHGEFKDISIKSYQKLEYATEWGCIIE